LDTWRSLTGCQAKQVKPEPAGSTVNRRVTSRNSPREILFYFSSSSLASRRRLLLPTSISSGLRRGARERAAAALAVPRLMARGATAGLLLLLLLAALLASASPAAAAEGRGRRGETELSPLVLTRRPVRFVASRRLRVRGPRLIVASLAVDSGRVAWEAGAAVRREAVGTADWSRRLCGLREARGGFLRIRLGGGSSRAQLGGSEFHPDVSEHRLGALTYFGLGKGNKASSNAWCALWVKCSAQLVQGFGGEGCTCTANCLLPPASGSAV
jgi:hypothetical protein